ncbi:hypothetical protein BMS3Abin03_02464 [bacterium BMS3Abin03]|nr:hypothetical protein BMS3Abin03_02464 [bacterium BMS3Abin03]
MKVLFLTFILILACFSEFTPAGYQTEKILSYDSKITVNENGSMIVVEKITIHSEGRKIKHGIFRDFPTKYKDLYGNNFNVEFKILEILRDGRKESYHTEKQNNGIRIYIGRKNYSLSPGDYSYTIKYKTDRMIGFFDKFDELYWNVTGNGWDFEIDKAGATVILPGGISGDDINYLAFTGLQGSKNRNYTAWLINNNTVRFETTGVLYPKEGLTIVIDWPKGFVTEPTFEKKLSYFISDNFSALIIFAGILLLLLYYFIVWFRVGIDPAKGVIIPLYEPPHKLSPAAARFIYKMKYDNKAFTSAIVDLCVKGFAMLEEDGKDYTLVKKNGDIQKLSKDEIKLISKLKFRSVSGREEFELKQKNHIKIKSAIKTLKKSLSNSYEKVYFYSNVSYFIAGSIISILIIIASVLTGSADFAFILFWNLFWCVGVILLLFTAFKNWRTALAGKIKGAALASAIFITLFSIPFVIGQFVGLYFLSQTGSILLIAGIVILVIVNIVFYHLLKAPTKLGRKIMDRIDGFRMYLSVAEQDRLNSIKEPEKTPELFEMFLPYAIALDVENEWGEKFADVLERAGSEYSPGWYNGASWSTIGAAGMVSSLGSSLTSTIASSSTVPGSSSGSGGGGFSGGGGGGGGGGGW